MSGVLPRVSVAICTYNGEPYLEAQLQSILRQSRQVDEIVVADDGSSDGTVSIIEQMTRACGADVIFLPAARESFGAAQNFSRALQRATGDYVFLSDQDDIWEPSRVESAIKSFEREGLPREGSNVRDSTKVVMVACDAGLIDAQGARMPGSLFSSMGLDECKRSQFELDAVGASLRASIFPGMALAVRRDLLQVALPIPARWPHDYWLVLVAGLAGRVIVLPEQLVLYRQHQSNVVGLRRRGLRGKLGRLMSNGSDSFRLATLFSSAHERLALESAFREEDLSRLRAKAEFESARLDLSTGRVRRVLDVIRLMTARGSYQEYSSNGRLHAMRDFLHAPVVPSDVAMSSHTLYSGKG